MNFVTYTTRPGQISINLQATLAASSHGHKAHYIPHHPITCGTDLRLYEDGGLSCEHLTVVDDPRTRECIDHSIAILLIELALETGL